MDPRAYSGPSSTDEEANPREYEIEDPNQDQAQDMNKILDFIYSKIVESGEAPAAAPATDEVQEIAAPSAFKWQTYQRSRQKRAGQATDVSCADTVKPVEVASPSSVNKFKIHKQEPEDSPGSSLCKMKTYTRQPSSCSSQQGDQGQARASTGSASSPCATLKTYRRRTSDNQLFQVANNYCLAAYKELMRIAKAANTWVVLEPGFGNMDDLLSEYEAAAPPGKKLELSVATAVVPNIRADQMADLMMNVGRDWSDAFFAIGTYGEAYEPRRILQGLVNRNSCIMRVVQVSTEVQLPTTLVPTRCFQFLRFARQVETAYVIVDISTCYFGETSVETNSVRRPSGVIIRGRGSNCEIIWVENVEVNEPSENIYSSVINTNIAFSANHWVSLLLWKLKRDQSIFTMANVDVNEEAGTFLLALTQAMRRFYMECVSKYPHNDLLSVATTVEDPVRILHNKTLENFVSYIGVNSFRVQAKPLSVFQFLIRKDLQLEFRPNSDLETEEEPELLFEFVTEDKSNVISLHRKKMEERSSRYCLQEASRNEYCSFILSKIITEDDLNLNIVEGIPSIYERDEGRTYDVLTSGFAIMPDGPGGLQCNGSLVTFLMQLQYDPAEEPPEADTIESVREDFIEDLNDLINELNAKVVGKDD